MEYSLWINGVDDAFIRELGCGCPRCLRPYRAANTSVSLMGSLEGRLPRHILFYVGAGISESVLANPLFAAQPTLDAVVLSHWHSDHAMELERVTITWMRSRQYHRLPWSALPVYSRQGAVAWLQRQYPGLEEAWLRFAPFGGEEARGQMMQPLQLDLPDARVTPISITHHSADADCVTGLFRPCCAGYLLETTNSRTALLWDLDQENTWLLDPEHPTTRWLRGLDHLLIDCDSWEESVDTQGRPLSHASLVFIQQITRVLQPHNTWLIHLSAHDRTTARGFGWLEETWQQEARTEWKRLGLPGQVHVPRIGQSIDL